MSLPHADHFSASAAKGMFITQMAYKILENPAPPSP
jgi:hypothetical protein